MRRIVIAVGLCSLLAACGRETQAPGPDGAPAQSLDYIDAVPIDKNAPAPIAQPQTAAKKDEPEAERKPPETDEVEAPATTARPAPSVPESAPKADDAAAATRRANETSATPYEATPRPD